MRVALEEWMATKMEKFFTEPSENSRIKAAIVSKYFWAWAKIIEKHSEKIAYIDLFAGPGRYDDGVKSTPLLVLEQALKDESLRRKLVSIFNDEAASNAKSLGDEISKINTSYQCGVKRLGLRMRVLFQF
jgi:three-Cys-motif partner protein